MKSSVMSPLQRRVVTPSMPREVLVRRSRLSPAGSWCGSIEARLGGSVDVVQEDNGYMSAYQPGVQEDETWYDYAGGSSYLYPYPG